MVAAQHASAFRIAAVTMSHAKQYKNVEFLGRRYTQRQLDNARIAAAL